MMEDKTFTKLSEVEEEEEAKVNIIEELNNMPLDILTRSPCMFG